MPYGEVRLRPGVNVEKTATLNEASISVSQLVRFKDSLVQKLGGWTKYFGTTISGVPRDLHAWQDLNSDDHLAVGSTTTLGLITSGSFKDISPQFVVTSPAENFTTVINTPTVTVVDAGITNVTILDSVLFNTPVSVGGIILSGLYTIDAIVGANSYRITAATNATSSTSPGAVPAFTTVSGASLVTVTLAAHGLVASDPNTVVFPASTTGNEVTIQGSYSVVTVTDANNFTINASNQANASSSFDMNGGAAQLVYYIALGPAAAGAGYGLGGYGEGGYGVGGSPGTSQTGAPIMADDWTSDNWGQILLACPEGGGVYQYDPTGGFTTSQLIATAPVFNGGIFVSMSQQILVCWGSTSVEEIGIDLDPLLVKWSDVGDYTQFEQLSTNQAGSYRIGIGSKIIGGLAAQNQNLLWTDLDLWAMSYQGPPFVFGFNKIGAGAGLVSSHAMQQLRGGVYWMGPSNFFSFDGSGISVLPCPVWDFVFQNLNTAFQDNVRSLPNTPFNEVGWAFPSLSSQNGENDSYVKFNLTEPNRPWDYGSLPRSAGIDQTILGAPIQATPTGIIYVQESGNDADGQPLVASFTTGYFVISPGEEFAFVDQIIPDFKYGTYAGAQGANINFSFSVLDYPGNTPVTYGPYTVTSTTEYIPVRFRGRQMSITISSSDIGSFWRIGLIRYRYAPAGRR